jgi:CSLREA domain-containing protein
MRGLAHVVAILVVGLAFGVAGAAAATITVTTTQDELTTNGQCSLREAIADVNTPGTTGDCAMSGDVSNTIVLGPHEYDVTIHPDATDAQQTGDLDVTGTTPLTIEGAGVGATTISGATLQDRILHVVAGTTVTIKDLTITGGHAPNGTRGQDGASTPTVTEPTAGDPGFAGGGIRNEGALTLEDVAVTNNFAGSGGLGGSGRPGTFGADENGMPGGAGGAGGGIYNAAPGSLTLTNVTVSGNFAGNGGLGGAGGLGATGAMGGKGGDGGCCGDGGGLDNVGGQVTVTGSTFSGDHAGAGGAGGQGQEPATTGYGGAGGQGQGGSSGGAIASSGATATVSIANSTLSGNFAGAGGNGGNGGGTNDVPIINWASGGGAGNGSAGGGLFVSGGATATLTNVTIDANQVGGPGTPGVVGSTTSCGGDCGQPLPGTPGNPAFGGGVYDSTTPATTLANTLLASNELGNCAGNLTDGNHNLSFGVSAGCPAGFAHGDPKLGSLADNGGPTQTQALQAGSAAIDQVPATGAGCPTTDQRGVARPSGTACDVGAYELAPPTAGTSAASALTTTSATVHGSVTPNQASAQIHFEYGTSTAYGSLSPVQSLSGLGAQAVTAALTNLRAHTTYHFRLVATSADGTTDSADRTLTTVGAPPPRLSGLAIKKKTTISYRDSEAATTTFTVFRATSGVKHGKRCTKKTRHARGRGCTLLAKLGSFEHADTLGANKFRLPARVGGHKLTTAKYVIRATPRLGASTGRTAGVTFKFRNF